MVTPSRLLPIVLASAALLTTAACGTPQPPTSTRTTSTGSAASIASPAQPHSPTSPGAQSSVAAGTQSSASPTAAAALPALSTSPRADRVIGADAEKAAWTQLATWILATGFEPNLIRTDHPEQADLLPVTNHMTTACRTVFDHYVSQVTTDNTNSIEAITSIGVEADHAVVAPGDQAVTDRTITSATADLDNQNALVIAVTSTAQIHFVTDTAPSTHAERTLTRTTAYTLEPDSSGDWLIDAWQGTFDLGPTRPS